MANPMTAFRFEGQLFRPEGVGTWTYVDIPTEASAALGMKGQMRVKGTINEHPFQSTAMPHGDGSHYLLVNRALRDATGANQGDIVQVVIEADTSERSITVPEDFIRVLDGEPEARTIFDKLSYSHKKEYVEWIESAKQTATRQKRMEKAVEMLKGGVRGPKEKKG
jgi:hypothetical protein